MGGGRLICMASRKRKKKKTLARAIHNVATTTGTTFVRYARQPDEDSIKKLLSYFYNYVYINI